MKPDDWLNLGIILGALLGGGAIGWRWVARLRAAPSPKGGAEPSPAERGAALSVGHIETGGGAVSVGGDVLDRRGGRGA